MGWYWVFSDSLQNPGDVTVFVMVMVVIMVGWGARDDDGGENGNGSIPLEGRMIIAVMWW